MRQGRRSVLVFAAALGAAVATWLLVQTPAALSADEPAKPTDQKPASRTAALFLIERNQPRILDGADRRGTETYQDYLLFRRTQAVLVKTRLVASAALRNPKVAELSLVKEQKDPVAWLQENLKVDFPNDAAVMRVFNYLEHDERKDYISDPRPGHIWESLEVIRQALCLKLGWPVDKPPK